MPYYLIEIMTNKQTKQTEKTMKNTIKGYDDEFSKVNSENDDNNLY